MRRSRKSAPKPRSQSSRSEGGAGRPASADLADDRRHARALGELRRPTAPHGRGRDRRPVRVSRLAVRTVATAGARPATAHPLYDDGPRGRGRCRRTGAGARPRPARQKPDPTRRNRAWRACSPTLHGLHLPRCVGVPPPDLGDLHGLAHAVLLSLERHRRAAALLRGCPSGSRPLRAYAGHPLPRIEPGVPVHTLAMANGGPNTNGSSLPISTRRAVRLAKRRTRESNANHVRAASSPRRSREVWW
jgi:hypothetical protein